MIGGHSLNFRMLLEYLVISQKSEYGLEEEKDNASEDSDRNMEKHALSLC